MKIRSITTFIHPGRPVDEKRLSQAADFNRAAVSAFRAAGFEVQTSRLATPPFPTLAGSAWSAPALAAYARQLEEQAAGAGFAYLSLGPAMPDDLSCYSMIPEAIAATQNTFFAGAMTDKEGSVSLSAVRSCAQVIHQAAPISPDGFANLRFSALANVPPGTPFFPAAYHHAGRGAAAFAVATEAADLAVKAFSNAKSLADARQRLVGLIETHATRLESTAEDLVRQFGLAFNGIDFSLAPFPKRQQSLGEAMQRLGLPVVGQPGSLAAAAILAEAVDQARFKRVGFSGLFLPVLEDAVLAQRAAEGSLTVKDLLLYSAVCGTGLDTVPIPGDVSVESLYALLLDLAVLSTRLDKPLTARLMPVPGKRAGEETGFDFEYLTNSRIMALDAHPLGGFLAGDGAFGLLTRKKA